MELLALQPPALQPTAEPPHRPFRSARMAWHRSRSPASTRAAASPAALSSAGRQAAGSSCLSCPQITPEALTAHLATLKAWQLAVAGGSARWQLVQTLGIPIPYGSSS
jgi:hypothetical protein